MQEHIIKRLESNRFTSKNIRLTLNLTVCKIYNQNERDLIYKEDK